MALRVTAFSVSNRLYCHSKCIWCFRVPFSTLVSSQQLQQAFRTPCFLTCVISFVTGYKMGRGPRSKHDNSQFSIAPEYGYKDEAQIERHLLLNQNLTIQATESDERYPRLTVSTYSRARRSDLLQTLRHFLKLQQYINLQPVRYKLYRTQINKCDWLFVYHGTKEA